MDSKLIKIMNDYYDSLTRHKASLDLTYNSLVELWGKSKKPKTITLAEEKNYTDGFPVIFNKEKYYILRLELTKDEVKICVGNYATDFTLADEILWYGNHDVKTLVIDEVAKHLGYTFEPTEENNKKKKTKKK